MTDPDRRRTAAIQFASTIAQDDASFARLFIDVYTAAARADAERRQVSNLRSLGVTEPPSVQDDPVYLANAKFVIEDDGRILNGVPTTEFPDCVAVGRLNGFCCSGTLIAPDLVLTAGHCGAGGCAAQVLVGNSITDPAARTFLVREAIIHPDYGSGPYNDLALLVLAQPIDGVAPRGIADPSAPETAGSVRLVGFGTTDPSGTFGYGERRRVDVPVASPDAAYGAEPATEFVAGAPFLDRDSCPGDSGGPAYVEIGGNWFLAGATSRATLGGFRMCGDGGVYERVGAYRDWIQSVLIASR